MPQRENLKLQAGPSPKRGAQSQKERKTTDRIDDQPIADVDNINLVNENRVPKIGPRPSSA